MACKVNAVNADALFVLLLLHSLESARRVSLPAYVSSNKKSNQNYWPKGISNEKPVNFLRPSTPKRSVVGELACAVLDRCDRPQQEKPAFHAKSPLDAHHSLRPDPGSGCLLYHSTGRRVKSFALPLFTWHKNGGELNIPIRGNHDLRIRLPVISRTFPM